MSETWYWTSKDERDFGKKMYTALPLYDLYDNHHTPQTPDDKQFSLRHFEHDLTRGGRHKSTKEAARVLIGDKDNDQSRFFQKGLNPHAKEFTSFKLKSKKSRRVSRKASRKSRRVSRKAPRKSRKVSRKASRKSRRVSRKAPRKSRKVSRKASRKSRRVSRKAPRKSRRVSRKVLRKSSIKSRRVSRKASRKSRRVSRRSRRSNSSQSAKRKSMGKRERSCKDLLKEKVGINIGEYKEGRYKSRQQAIAVAYNQLKKMKPSCDKYLKKNI
jgi:hypothetical protein